MYKKLYKVRRGAKIDGVCAGLANYMDMDPTAMRLIWVVGTLFLNVAGLVAYFICSMVMPREPEFYEHHPYNPHDEYNNPNSN